MYPSRRLHPHAQHRCASATSLSLILALASSLGAMELEIQPLDPLALIDGYDATVDFREPKLDQPQWLPMHAAVDAAAHRSQLRLVAPIGGIASAPVLANQQISAVMRSPLRGTSGTIPLDAIRIRYARYHDLDKASRWRRPGWAIESDQRKQGGTLPPDYRYWEIHRPYILQEAPARHPGVHPIWLTVQVPEDASPGLYHSELAFGAHSVPVELTITSFRLPAAGADVVHIGAMWSYERLAEHFRVAPWSQDHVDRMTQLHAYLKALGNDPLVITMLADEYLGDEEQGNYLGDRHAMLRFRRENGRLAPDWTVVDLVLQRYGQEVGVPSHLVLHCWSQPTFGVKSKHLGKDLPAPEEVRLAVTVIEDDGSLATDTISPPYLDDHRELWQRLFAEFDQRLTRLGWQVRLVLGSASDGRPRQETVEAFAALGQNDWLVCSHGRGVVLPDQPGEELRLGTGMRVGYWEHVYAPGLTLRDDGILGGWNAPFIQYSAMRNYLRPEDPLSQYRGIVDAAVATGRINDQALQAADLNQRDRDRFARELVENAYSAAGITRLPLLPGDHDEKGLKMAFPGVIRMNPRFLLTVDGDLLQPTVPMLMLLEGRQETEARILLEKALLEGRLSAELMQETRSFLIERIRILTRDGSYSSAAGLDDGTGYSSRMLGIADDWQSMTARLFDLAGRVQRLR